MTKGYASTRMTVSSRKDKIADPTSPEDVLHARERYYLAKVHLGCACREHHTLLPSVWHGELDLAVQPTRSQQGGIERIRAVCRHDDLIRVRDKGRRRRYKTDMLLQNARSAHVCIVRMYRFSTLD